jgi:hypothetical protein
MSTGFNAAVDRRPGVARVPGPDRRGVPAHRAGAVDNGRAWVNVTPVVPETVATAGDRRLLALSPHRIVVESRRQRSLDEEFLETLGSALFRLARFVLRHSMGLVIIPYGLWTLATTTGRPRPSPHPGPRR